MHYSNIVIIEKPEDGDIKKAVEEAMGPHEEDGGFWDWFQIGGRWTGVLTGYDPEKDPRNADTERGGAKWPTQWAEYEGDIQPVENVTEDAYKKFFRVVVRRHTFGCEEYLPWKPIDGGKMFKKREMPPLDWLKKEYEGHIAIVVDNHS